MKVYCIFKLDQDSLYHVEYILIAIYSNLTRAELYVQEMNKSFIWNKYVIEEHEVN